LARKCAVKTPEGFFDNGVQVEAFQHKAALLIQQTATTISSFISQGKTFEEAWNESLVEVIICFF